MEMALEPGNMTINGMRLALILESDQKLLLSHQGQAGVHSLIITQPTRKNLLALLPFVAACNTTNFFYIIIFSDCFIF